MISLQLKKCTFKFMHYKLKFLEKLATIKSGLVVQSTDIFCTFLSQTRFLHRVTVSESIIGAPKMRNTFWCSFKMFIYTVKTALV